MKIINDYFYKNEKIFFPFQKIKFKKVKSVESMIEKDSNLIQRYTDDLYNLSENIRFYREKYPSRKNISQDSKKQLLPQIRLSRNETMNNFNKISINLNAFIKKGKSKSFVNNSSSFYSNVNNFREKVNKNIKKNLIKLYSFERKKIKNRSFDILLNNRSSEKERYIHKINSYKLKKNTKKLLNISKRLSNEEKEKEYYKTKLFKQIKNDLGREKIKKDIKKIRSFNKEKIKNFQKKSINIEIEKNHADLINFCDIYYKMEDSLFYSQKGKEVFINYPLLRKKANIVKYSGEKLKKEINEKTMNALKNNSIIIKNLYDELKGKKYSLVK